MTPAPMRVTRVRWETSDTLTLTLDSSAQKVAFAPGQFNMLYAFAVGEVALSMSGDSLRTDELVHTIKAVGAVTEALCRIRKGGTLGVRGPYGQPWPIADCEGGDLLLIAGGLGLAPLRPVLYHVIRNRLLYKQISLLVGARTPEDLLYRRELTEWERRPDLRVLVTVDRAGPNWKGRVGVVPALVSEASFDPNRTVAYVCGPEVMMRFCVRELKRRGLPDERIYLSMERNMKCAVGFCGHCQYGPSFVCKDGPVLGFDRIRSLFWQREI
jgi:NAD(P)H-flavin reductase